MLQFLQRMRPGDLQANAPDRVAGSNSAPVQRAWKLRLRSLLVILATIACSWQAQAQVTYQIGSGTTTDAYFPIYSCYVYNYSQQIYTSSEITGTGAAGPQTISKLRFYYDNGGTTTTNWNNFTIYLGNTAICCGRT